MAAKGQRIGALRWDIVADNSQLVTAIKGSNRMTKDLSRAMKMTRTPMERYTKGLLDARNAIKRGAIDGKAYRYELLRLQKQLGKEQLALDSNTRAVRKNTKAKIANRAASGGGAKNLANVLGSGLSGIGAGGAAAGAGRSLGLMSGGLVGFAAGGLFAHLATEIKAAKEYAKLETDIVELQVFMGKKKGAEYAEQFRNIARESSLTTSQLVKNAAVIKSYGVELEDIVDFTQRLGEASGGDSAMFNQMTKAFAQVNALGKLMGQEKNQLVNAGFSLKLIAREAQIPMDEFAKAMENGLITAQHVNDALITATSEGGLFYGRLQAKADTLAGKWDILINSSNELFAMMGRDDEGWLKDTIDNLTSAVNRLAQRLDEKNTIKNLKAEEDFYRNKLGLAPRGSNHRGPNTPGYGGSYTAYGSNGMVGDYGAGFTMSATDSIMNTNVEGITSWWSGANSFWDVLTLDAKGRRLKNAQEYQQQQQATASLKKKANDAGIFMPEVEEVAFDDANIVDMSDRLGGTGSGSGSGPGLSDFGAGSMGEYGYLRDKLTADRDLAQKSYDALVTIAQNTGGEPGNNQSWRSKARQGLKDRRWRQDQMADVATDLYGWAMQGFRTDEQVNADQRYNAMSDPEGGTFAEERRRKSAEIYDKYSGSDGLLSSRFGPGDNNERAFNISNSEWGLYTKEVREMTTELKAQFKRKKQQEDRKEELGAIKKNVDETRGVKGVLTNIFDHMKSVKENSEAI
jgi:tape measure domain-containing protein